ncbi:hypothetical protein CVS40_3420 [Lucilia cuprina]|nr:hypothetical protein CVS40_3420 [Lucilia cuprina]
MNRKYTILPSELPYPLPILNLWSPSYLLHYRSLYKSLSFTENFTDKYTAYKNTSAPYDYHSKSDNVLQEYIDLGHMKLIKYNPNTPSNTHYYLPHHAVIKLDCVTTKVRVVFNASSKTSNSNTHFQRILFRKSVNEPIQDELQTVTFGVNCAPYLAIRTLHKLADDIQNTHPIASQILRNNMYVNDVLAGGRTIEEAQKAL